MGSISMSYKICTIGIPACPSNHSAIMAVDDMWMILFQYLFTQRYYKKSAWCAKEYIENKNKKLLTYSFVIDTI